MRLLIVHPGSAVSTHDVFMGVMEGLRDLGHDVHVYPLDRKIAAAGKFLCDQRKIERETLGMDHLPETVPHAEILMQATEGLIVRALTTAPDYVLIVSGMYVPLHTLQLLKLAKIKIALLLTESPYDEESEVKWSQIADVTFTNERTTARKLGVHYLPHAWRRGFHDRTVAELPEMSAHDCVFVGTGFGERADWLRRYADAGGPLTLYGTWPQEAMRPYLADPSRDEWCVTNEEAAALYARARVTLNLYRRSKGDSGFSEQPRYIAEAESLNPRAYELAALGVPHVSQDRAEVREKFGADVPVCESPEDAAFCVRMLMSLHPRERERLSASLRRAVANDTWHDRAKEIARVLS